MPSSGLWRHVDLAWTDVSEEDVASIFKVETSASEEPAWAGGCRLHGRDMSTNSKMKMRKKPCKIWGFRSNENYNYCVLAYVIEWSLRGYRRFEGRLPPSRVGIRIVLFPSFILKTREADFTENLEATYATKWHYNPEDHGVNTVQLVTVAERSKVCIVSARSEAGIVGSNPTQGMDVWYVYVFILCLCYPVFR
jgi:hypothetical protein